MRRTRMHGLSAMEVGLIDPTLSDTHDMDMDKRVFALNDNGTRSSAALDAAIVDHIEGTRISFIHVYGKGGHMRFFLGIECPVLNKASGKCLHGEQASKEGSCYALHDFLLQLNFFALWPENMNYVLRFPRNCIQAQGFPTLHIRS